MAVTAAICGLMLCAVAALTVDGASVALKAREVQGAADLAAVTAAANLTEAEAAARATARANIGDAAVQVMVGRYAPNREISPASRFSPATVDAANGARVTVEARAPLYFGRWILGRDSVAVRRTATAAARPPCEPAAAFSIGSRVARLDGGAANALLSALTGSRVSLDVADYEALADADVDLLTYVDALATELDVTAADYDSLLEREVQAGTALGVLEDLLDGAAGDAVGTLAAAATDRRLDLSGLIGGEAGDMAGLSAKVSALALARAVLEVANQDRQVALELGVRTGLADLDVDLAIGERPNGSPWLTVTDTGDPVIRTAQARLRLRARTAQTLSGLAQVHVPIVVEVAASEARLADLDCAGGRSVALDVRLGLARAWIGEIDDRALTDFKMPLSVRKARLLTVPLVKIEGRADVEAGDSRWSRVRFSGADTEGGAMRTVTSSQLASGLVSSLVSRLQVDIDVLGLGLGLGGLSGALGTLLAPLGPVLDATLNPVLDLLGLRLGQADVTLNGLRCPDGRPPAPMLVG